jgi:PAB1-binding protein PBP1
MSASTNLARALQMVRLIPVQPIIWNISANVSGVSSFKTDTDISGNAAGRERTLQKWEPSSEIGEGMSLEADGKGWDQFETNTRLFGLKTDYDEKYYTTEINKSHPDYETRAAKAERAAREIEAGKAFNAHVAEERGVADDSGIDEEMK